MEVWQRVCDAMRWTDGRMDERMDGWSEGFVDARNLNMRHFGWRGKLGENDHWMEKTRLASD